MFAAILGLAVLLAFAWVERRTDTALPTPTGPFAVGRDYWTLADDTADLLSPVPGTRRKLLVWMWFPATADARAVVDAYYPALPATPSPQPVPHLPLISRVGISLFALLTHEPSTVHGHGLRNAEVSPQQRSYPVVIMRAGGSSSVLNLSTLAEDLASHGYVVVGLDAPYRTAQVIFPDGRIVRRTDENNPELGTGEERIARVNKLLSAWTSDMTFVLGRLEHLQTSDPGGKFAGRLDTTHVGAFGHSFGGAQSAQFCQEDSRCAAAIDVDGMPFGSVIQKGVPRPFMFIVSQQIHDTDAESLRVKAEIQSIYDRLPPNDRCLSRSAAQTISPSRTMVRFSRAGSCAAYSGCSAN